MEILSRTGMRASEVCGLDPDAVVCIGDNHWLRVPVGKLRNDRYVPLHPDLVALLAAWTADNLEHIRRHRRLIAITADRSTATSLPESCVALDAKPASKPTRTTSATPSRHKPN